MTSFEAASTCRDSRPKEAASLLVEAAAFLLLFFLVDFLLHPDDSSARTAPDLVFLLFGIHVVASLYVGRFGWLRTTSWLILNTAFLVLLATAFHTLAWTWMRPAISFVVDLRDAIGAGRILSDRTAMTIMAQVLLLVDVALAQAVRLARWRRTRSIAFVLAIPVVVFTADYLVAHYAQLGTDEAGTPTPSSGEPPFYEQAFLTVFLAVPNQMLGLAFAFVISALPLAAPWMRAWRFHAPETRIVWMLLCIGLAAGWLLLLVLGLIYRPITTAIFASAAYQIVFFVVVPPVLGAVLRHSERRRRAVFD